MRNKEDIKIREQLFDYGKKGMQYEFKIALEDYVNKKIRDEDQARLGSLVTDLKHNVKIEIPVHTDTSQLRLI